MDPSAMFHLEYVQKTLADERRHVITVCLRDFILNVCLITTKKSCFINLAEVH